MLQLSSEVFSSSSTSLSQSPTTPAHTRSRRTKTEAHSAITEEIGRIARSRAHTNETTQQQYNVETPRIDDHQFLEEQMGSDGDLSKVCSQIVLNACIQRAVADPMFFGS